MTNEPQNAACQQKAALTTDNCQINQLATCNKGSPEIPCMKISGTMVPMVLLASNIPLGSVINRDFSIPYVLYVNKELLLSEIALFVNFRK